MTDDAPPAQPTPGEAAFTRAVARDRDGDQAGAIPLYREALAAGLSDELELRARIGLASSLRETGDAAAAIEVHVELAARAPQLSANRLFLALARARAGDHDAALAEAITVALDLAEADPAAAPDLAGDAPTLRAYAARLAGGASETDGPASPL